MPSRRSSAVSQPTLNDARNLSAERRRGTASASRQRPAQLWWAAAQVFTAQPGNARQRLAAVAIVLLAPAAGHGGQGLGTIVVAMFGHRAGNTWQRLAAIVVAALANRGRMTMLPGPVAGAVCRVSTASRADQGPQNHQRENGAGRVHRKVSPRFDEFSAGVLSKAATATGATAFWPLRWWRPPCCGGPADEGGSHSRICQPPPKAR